MRMPSFKRMGGLTVAELIEVVQEIDQSRLSGHETSILLNTAEKNDQFQATRRWNRLLTGFYKGMERKRCRRLLKSYPDSFVGKAAIQFLLTNIFPRIVPNKPVDE
uniref:Uncharacterized protein n=1 Tax=Panagrolaimus superbus TaxID=310955 RepID=A0A914Y0A0_9BILA